MSQTKIVWCDCRTCSRKTRHEILSAHEDESDPIGYHEKYTWQVVRCLGCETYGFLRRYDDFESVFEDPYGELHNESSLTVYPSVLSDHRALEEHFFLPSLIQKVYRQTVQALSDKSYVLASMGLRACIEAVCNNLKVSGATLEKRIDQLFKGGYVSNGDKLRLHAIRFLGNDAAHEIIEPKGADIRVALDIVEHLLNSVFVLKAKAKSLDTVAEDYDDFIRLLSSSIKKREFSNSVSLAGILGKRRRLISQGFDDFEQKLKQEVASGTVPYLTLAQSSKIGGKEVQLYEVDSEKLSELDPDPDFPF
jgi:hypothetical protein